MPEWNPASLLNMDAGGPIPKLPPLEPFATNGVPVSS